MPKTAPQGFDIVVASAKRLLANNPNDTLNVLVTKVIPRWERDSGPRESMSTPEVAALLVRAASNRQAKMTHEQLVNAMRLPVIEWPYHLCIPLAIARKVASIDPVGAISIRTRAADFVHEVYSHGLVAYLDNFCLSGGHLQGEDFYSSV